MSSSRPYLEIVKHYEECLRRHGDTHLGVDWPNPRDAATRYRVMLDVVRPGPSDPPTLLDFGCGAGHLLEYLRNAGEPRLEYSGLDVSAAFVELARRKFPSVTFYCQDLLEGAGDLPLFDYVVLNGVFTEKRGLARTDMVAYFRQLLSKVFAQARLGMAFNVMSAHVDWERDDLFHVPFDEMAGFLRKELSRHFVFRNDYGLHEYTTYVYR